MIPGVGFSGDRAHFLSIEELGDFVDILPDLIYYHILFILKKIDILTDL